MDEKTIEDQLEGIHQLLEALLSCIGNDQECCKKEDCGCEEE